MKLYPRGISNPAPPSFRLIQGKFQLVQQGGGEGEMEGEEGRGRALFNSNHQRFEKLMIPVPNHDKY